MARTAGKKQATAKIEDDDDSEGWDDAVVEADGKDGGADLRLRDWRDVERFREMKELRSLIDDDYGLDEIFHVPLKARADVPPRTAKPVAPTKAAPTPKAAARAPAPAKAEMRPAPKPEPKKPKAVAKPAKAKAHAKPKAKRR